ncbi:MAG TPA: LysM domain-containing protein [Ignavibacteria bacterium]|nr:LysM domain-containing protein [Ignavibacteria bacterium]
MKTKLILIISLVMMFVLPANFANAHCDTKDGPVVADARKALEQNNVNYVLKWVQATDEKEIKESFELTMKVRVLSPEAQTLADNYFFETLVRIHRSGEGVPYTGVKPSGTPVDEKILAADKAIALGNLSPLNELVPKDKFPELQKRFDKVMSLKNFDVNNVQAGREYIEAYVQFFHFAEGEEEGHNHSQAAEDEHKTSHIEDGGHLGHLPWILTGIFFITSIIFGILYYRRKEK